MATNWYILFNQTSTKGKKPPSKHTGVEFLEPVNECAYLKIETTSSGAAGKAEARAAVYDKYPSWCTDKPVLVPEANWEET